MMRNDCVSQSFRYENVTVHKCHIQYFSIAMSADGYCHDFLPPVQANRECPFGDKCHFHHDVAEYLATKPADIGDSCYLYDTFGKCAYGLSCRFAMAHTTADFKTMENAELIKAHEGRTAVKNSLSKDLQNRLRKRSVAFKKSAEYLKTLSNDRDKKEQQGNGKRTEEVLDNSCMVEW